MILSVLDQSPISERSSGAQALHNSVDLARFTEALGYERYWVAEHHGTPGLACASPEALIGPIAMATSRMRVGSGGVMLPHYMRKSHESSRRCGRSARTPTNRRGASQQARR